MAREDRKAPVSIPVTETNDYGALLESEFVATTENAAFECAVAHAVALSQAIPERLCVDLSVDRLSDGRQV
jgi:hypothetical protein